MLENGVDKIKFMRDVAEKLGDKYCYTVGYINKNFRDYIEDAFVDCDGKVDEAVSYISYSKVIK